MKENEINQWRKIKFHRDGSIEIDRAEIMRQYREQFKKSERLEIEHARKFGNFQKRPSR